MGTLNVRSGRLQLDFRYRGIRCREQTKFPDSARNRTKLKRLLERIEAEILLDSFNYAAYFPNSVRVQKFKEIDRLISAAQSGVPVFEEFANLWFTEMEVSWRASHRDTVRSNLDSYLIPEFGHKPVSAIKRQDVLGFRANLCKRKGRVGKRFSPEWVNHIISPLRMILNEAAIRYDFISPMQGMKGLPVPRNDVEPFSLDEVQAFLENIRPDYRLYYTVRFFTGLRTSEIDGLTWRYVDLDRRTILVRQSLVKGVMGPTKTDGSSRDVHMSSIVHDALACQKEKTGYGEHVFVNGAGNPLCHNNVTKRVWYPMLRFLNLRKRTPYQTRHTAASLWLASGENPEWVARQLGHSTTEMLFRRYSRFIPNVTRQDGSAMEALLSENWSK